MKCPKCGSELVKKDDILVCGGCKAAFKIKARTDTGCVSLTTVSGVSSKPENSTNKSAETPNEQQSEIELLKARLAEMERKQAQIEKENQNKIGDRVKALWKSFKGKKWVFRTILAIAIIVTAIVLMVSFIGVRGVYYNVNDPNEFYSFTAGKYKQYYNFLGEEMFDEGTWKIKDNTIYFAYEKELFGKIEDEQYFKRDGYGTIYIGDDEDSLSEYKRVQLSKYSSSNKKIKVTFDANGGEGGCSKKIKLGSILKAPEVTREGYRFVGWYTEPKGYGSSSGERFKEDVRIWEEVTYYANWYSEDCAKGNHSLGDNCTCVDCGVVAHNYVNCICTKCSKSNHNYFDCICTKCGQSNHTLDENCICANCGGEFHTLVYHAAQDATCTSVGWSAYKTCANCNYTTYKEITALGYKFVDCVCTECGDTAHILNSSCICIDCKAVVHKYIDGVCTNCGVEKPLYTRDGDYIYFGTYPQSAVSGRTLQSTLTSKAGTLPTASNPTNWTSYGYYISSTVTDFMWYIDLTYGGEQYRGVYFTSYRPSFPMSSGSAEYSKQDNNGYYTSTVYWFKYEPIKWRILSEEGGEALILCEMIIDSQEYYDNYSTRTINGSPVYENNYAYSNIRSFLNETFYNTAFTTLEKDLILLTEVDNSARSTNLDNDATYYNGGESECACSNTNDYIFLLSKQEATKSAYGFSTSDSDYDSLRQKKTTAYAQCQGASTSTYSSYKGNGWWWLRSPIYRNCNDARDVDCNGDASSYSNVNLTRGGVVPALKIKLN